MPDDQESHEPTRHPAKAAETSRPIVPELEGEMPLPEELTGRASGTDETLTALFGNDSAGHLADGFRGGSNADQDVAIPREHEVDPEVDPR